MPAAFLSVVALTIALRGTGAPFTLALIALLLLVGELVVFWGFIFPVNQATENWTMLPDAKDGRLVLAKGYGMADMAGEAATPETMFLLASLSKPITAAAILKLIEEGKLRLDDFVIDYLRHLVPAKGPRDPQVKVTIRQLLNHSGGWDRDKGGDPSTWTPQVAQRFGLPAQPTANQLIAFIMTAPLDFEPGTQTHYSNLGYIYLGAVIEKVTGQSYENYVRKNVLEPMGIKKAHIQGGTKYRPGEAKRYLAGMASERRRCNRR